MNARNITREEFEQLKNKNELKLNTLSSFLLSPNEHELNKILTVDTFYKTLTPRFDYTQMPRAFFPVLPIPNEVVSNSTTGKIQYGEYPQQVVTDEERKELERKFANQKNTTGKTYTLYFSDKDKAKEYPEYEFDGEKYIRIAPKVTLNLQGNTEKIKDTPTWIKVTPIHWIRTGNGEMVSPVCLSCMPQNDKKAQAFLETFCKDIIPSGTRAQERQKPSRRRGYGVSVQKEDMSVKEQLDFYFQHGYSIMLHGPSGVGKSARVEQIDPDLTMLPLPDGALPEDVVGKVVYPNGLEVDAMDQNGKCVPIPKGGHWAPPSWYKTLCEKCTKEPDKKHVLFIDEVTNAGPSTQALIYHLVHGAAISAGNGELPHNAVVFLAGNSKEESSAAFNMPEPLARRMVAHITLEPNIKEWLEWGSKKNKKYPEDEERLNIHPLVAAFVATYGDKIFYTPYDEENPAPAMDPRGWAQISDLIYDNSGVIGKQLMLNKMGEELASSFLAFAKDPPLTAEDILCEETENIVLPESPDAKLALIYSLRLINQRELKKVRGFIRANLGKESEAVFDQVWADDDEKKILLQQMKNREAMDRRG